MGWVQQGTRTFPGTGLFWHEKASLSSLQLCEQGTFRLSPAVLSSRWQREREIVLAVGGIGQSTETPDREGIRQGASVL